MGAHGSTIGGMSRIAWRKSTTVLRAVPFSLLSAHVTQSYYCLAHRINKNKIPETKVTVEGSPSRNITRKHDLDPNK